VAAAFLATLLSGGCSSMNNTEKGVLGGGAIGAGTGAIVGHALGNTGAGALVGAGVGALSGGLIGNGIDESEKKTEAKIAAATAASRPPLGMTDIAQMSQQHISDSVIIEQIRSTGSVYQLSPTDIYWLKQNGVSDTVVREMQETATRYPRRVYTATPVYPAPVYERVYVYDPPPPVSFGIGYTHYRRW
jgi:hypothetical protein